MAINFVISLCSNIQNKQGLTDGIVSRLIADNGYSRSIIDRTDSILGSLSFSDINKAVCNGNIKCCIFLGEKLPLLHLAHLELFEHSHHVTTLLSGKLDPSDLEIRGYISELLYQICNGLKCYSPTNNICWASAFTSSSGAEQSFCYRVDTDHNVSEASGASNSTMYSHALKIASASWDQVDKQ